MYSIDFDPAARVITLRNEGYWTLATVAAFAVEALARGTAIRLRYGKFATLLDARDFPLQEASVARAIEAMTVQTSRLTDGPTVIVTASMLGKLQALRIVRSDDVHVFLDYDEAVAWLDAHWQGCAAD